MTATQHDNLNIYRLTLTTSESWHWTLKITICKENVCQYHTHSLDSDRRSNEIFRPSLKYSIELDHTHNLFKLNQLINKQAPFKNECTLLTYKSFFTPIITNTSSFWFATNKKNHEKLQILQNKYQEFHLTHHGL